MATRNKSFFTNPFIAVALGCVMAFAVACGDDDDSGTETPMGGSKAMGGTGGGSSAGKSNGGSSSAGKAAAGDGPVTTGGGGAGPDVPGDGGAAGAGGAPANCTDDADMGCFSCTPKTHEQYLNHCPTTGCEPFDNETLGSLKDGVLPELP